MKFRKGQMYARNHMRYPDEVVIFIPDEDGKAPPGVEFYANGERVDRELPWDVPYRRIKRLKETGDV